MKIPEHTKRTLESGRVCSQCGGKLTGIKTVDNSGNPTIWAGCEHCSIFNGGVDEKTFQIARRMVIEDRIYLYSHMDKPSEDDKDDWEYFVDSQTGAMTRLVGRISYLLTEDTNEAQKEVSATSEVKELYLSIFSEPTDYRESIAQRTERLRLKKKAEDLRGEKA